MPHGSLIVFDGVDGCGKGTQIALLEKHLVETGFSCVLTKEPGGTGLGQEIRRLLFNSIGTKNMAPGVCQALIRASHLHNCHTVIKPSLEEGKVVLCDRYSPITSCAYEPEHSYPQMSIVPDLIIHLYGDPALFRQRAMDRTEETHQGSKVWNTPERLARIQEQYFIRLNEPDVRRQWVPLRADDATPAEIHAVVRRHVSELLRGERTHGPRS